MRASYGAAPVGDDAEIDDASDALLARGAGRRVTRGVALAFAAGCLVGCLARGGRGDLSPLFLATAPATRARGRGDAGRVQPAGDLVPGVGGDVQDVAARRVRLAG
jgi:hypothetical protein